MFINPFVCVYVSRAPGKYHSRKIYQKSNNGLYISIGGFRGGGGVQGVGTPFFLQWTPLFQQWTPPFSAKAPSPLLIQERIQGGGASRKKTQGGGGGVQFEILKNPGIDFIVASGKPLKCGCNSNS